MTKIDRFEFPDELYYTSDHVWARVEGSQVTLGLTQFGQELAGQIVFVEAPRVGRKVKQGEPFMSMESGKWVGRVKAPLSGSITEANGEIEWESTLVNQEPYGQGWLAKLEATNLDELAQLLRPDSAGFAALIAAERAKYSK